ncbi:hypothetical protein SKAU_G00147900 [Synaphobranchus kaupii]|uniref:Secreted protein n=1 Tax=Synaphobranchus kaupii TaxID=118154 RepID=A0A9Q1J3Y0_SYNKA|nr:hypothetical protein SKAU_G00147900 [Synaphobranchus kaupii]
MTPICLGVALLSSGLQASGWLPPTVRPRSLASGRLRYVYATARIDFPPASARCGADKALGGGRGLVRARGFKSGHFLPEPVEAHEQERNES